MSKAADLANLIGNINAGGGGVNRNVIINGAMNVYQRGSDTIDHDGTTSGYVLDRFKLDTSGMDELHLTVTQDSSVPSGQGFANSMKVDITTAESALASDEYIRILHGIEAQNLQMLNYGTSDAKTITLSFWVRSNLTSTFAVSIYQADGDRIIGSTYSISTADTWEKKTITFEGDTGGTINDDNGAGFYINFCLGTGSDRTGTDNSSWSAFANAKMFNGQVANITSSASNDFYLTGVQLEVGQNPTEFEHEPYATTFEKCLRYFYAVVPKGEGNAYIAPAWNYSSSTMVSIIDHKVEMRAAPTVETNDASNDFRFYRNNTNDDFDEMALSSPSTRRATAVYNGSDISGTAGHAGGIFGNDATNAYFYLKAEL